MSYEAVLEELGIRLPAPLKPVGSYRPVVTAGKFAFLSGQISKPAAGPLVTGKVGADLTLDEGKEAARHAALQVVSLIRSTVGWGRFERLVRVAVYVQCRPDFYDISQVANGASDLFAKVFGEKGIHARSAVGAASLPLNAAVEIEAAVQLKS